MANFGILIKSLYMKLITPVLFLAAALSFGACNDNSSPNTSRADAAARSDSSAAGKDLSSAGIRGENVTISADTTNMQCFVAYNDSSREKRPIILVLPEWWGMTDYPKMRARELAKLGYLAMAVDIYGNGAVAATPDQAKSYAGRFYSNPQLAASRIQAALAKAKTYPEADTSKTAAIGYCFGGSMVLNTAKLGAPLTGVVSFHGGLAGVTPAKNTIKSRILVCHGMADKFVSPQEVKTFRKQLDSVGAKYTFIEYPGATHAFTNPDADANAKKFNMPIAYNAEADKKSWEDMKNFFAEIFK